MDIGGLNLSLNNEDSGHGWIGGDISPEALGPEYVYPCSPSTLVCSLTSPFFRYAELLSKMYNDTRDALQNGKASYVAGLFSIRPPR